MLFSSKIFISLMRKTSLNNCLIWGNDKVLSKLPFIGTFRTAQKGERLEKVAAELTATIVVYGGMYYIMARDMPMMEPKKIHQHTAIMLGEMHALMFVGSVGFNIIYSIGNKIYHYCHSDDKEESQLIPSNPESPKAIY